MTVIFSIAHVDLIVVAVDSVETRTFQNKTEYSDEANKAYLLSGVGCVATWGRRTGNNIGRVLRSHDVSPESHSVEDIADLTYIYLTEEYRPHEENLDDVGYHVAGFDQERTPHLYHIFWGFDRPRRFNQTERHYVKGNHSPQGNSIQFLYNGRNDLAEKIIFTVIEQFSQGLITRFDLRNLIDRVRFADLVIRFAAEVTPEVGPDFHMFLISPTNQIVRIVNKWYCPISERKITKALTQLELV